MLTSVHMYNNQTPRVLSHDEKNAAEAAFAGKPLNPKWSARARIVYEGIIRVLPAPSETPVEVSEISEETAATSDLVTRESVTQPEGSTDEQSTEAGEGTANVPIKIPFQQALETGALIDVTPTAKQLGFSFPVTVTKPLWDVGIAPVKTLTQEEQAHRLRDVLMAFRLRLATQPTISPLIDFPALLAFPPNNVPQ
ncbi:MAG TPA: hypothetical protein VF819_04890, partial [Nitrospira sp.]